uniref:Uncharacterized protein n=1 Tax=Myotis myotis TaxID=51298 RepID=A0A7J7VYA6_MYOMY|nr:hypothetical protein mMyoMyo1_012215 [Myotis myotis]
MWVMSTPVMWRGVPTLCRPRSSRSSAVLPGLPAEPGTWASGPPGTEIPETWAVCLLRQEPARTFLSGRGCLVKKDKRRVLTGPDTNGAKGILGTQIPKPDTSGPGGGTREGGGVSREDRASYHHVP